MSKNNKVRKVIYLSEETIKKIEEIKEIERRDLSNEVELLLIQKHKKLFGGDK